MPNTNVLVNPDVKGNISSCTTNITYLVDSSRNSLWTVQDAGYATNNCTGKVDNFQSWELSGFSIGMIVLGSIVLIIGLLKITLD